MSDFTRSIIYSGFVLVAGLVAIFAISSNLTSTDPNSFAVIEPAAGIEEPSAPAEAETMTEAEESFDADNEVEKLRTALEEAGINVSEVEPASGEEISEEVEVTIDEMTTEAEETVEDVTTEIEETVEEVTEETTH